MTGEGASLRLPHRLGTYELLRPLAQGGMADIYLARRRGPGQFERQVALKVLSERRAEDPEACAMFLDEARLVAMLHHRNIASVLEVDVVDGKHYLAMEYVHGADLREVLLATQRSGARMPFATAITIVCAAAAGLDHAHRRCGNDGKPLRLVHRDVSLSNIMLGHDGSVKVIDFGIASTAIATVHTSPGVVRGKASYMSPEQCMGDPVDHRSDVFALGVVLYELTTGARCFHGKTDFDRMLAVVRTDYLAPSELVAGYPAALEAVIRTALAARPHQRFASAAAMIEALEHIAAQHGWAGGPAVIERMMASLFGDRSASLPSLTDVELAPPLAPPAAEPTRPVHRLARGTETRRFDDALDDDPDERTRGRGPVRRARPPWRAA